MAILNEEPSAGASSAQERLAIQSCYQHSMWSHLCESGAPAVMLPSQVAYLSAEDALQWIAQYAPLRLQEAIWTLVRGIAPATLENARSPLRHAMDPHFDVVPFLKRKQHYSVAASLFAAALAAYAHQEMSVKDLRDIYRAAKTAGDFSDAVAEGNHLSGATPDDFLADLPDPDGHHIAAWLLDLEHDVRGGLFEFVASFADAVAFKEVWEGAPSRQTEQWGVWPVTTYSMQNVGSLTTTVTVTALVQCPEFRSLCATTDPHAWPCCSDVFQSTRYVDAAGQTLPWPPLGSALPPDQPHILEEVVNLRMGLDDDQIGWFRNLLNISFEIDEQPGDERADLFFSLNRAVESRVLWDQRPGGIVVDQGFSRVRRLRDGLWRMTTRKALRFSDRETGNEGSGGFGDMLTYLTPATLSWWIESEMYSGACPKLVEMMQASGGGGT